MVCIIPLFSTVILLPSSGHSISDTIETGIRRNLQQRMCMGHKLRYEMPSFSLSLILTLSFVFSLSHSLSSLFSLSLIPCSLPLSFVPLSPALFCYIHFSFPSHQQVMLLRIYMCFRLIFLLVVSALHIPVKENLQY